MRQRGRWSAVLRLIPSTLLSFEQIGLPEAVKPLLRKPGSERGAAAFEVISWDQAFDLMTERLAKIRSTDPKKFALFTGRDQMQALTGLFARQFGTPNYAAHGGFCSIGGISFR